VSRSAIVVLLSKALLATTVLGGAVAASSAPAELAKLSTEPDADSGEAASPGPDAQPGAAVTPLAPEGGTAGQPQAATAEPDDRAYLRVTASPGDTMTRQGPDLAIARLNPEFVARLADAIREARQSGLPSAGIFSAYRPPGFGIGGFGDKFKSLHAYGLAVDMSGIGDPGSEQAKLWHTIAARHGVICPYGYASRTEWNHCQATQLEKVVPGDPLRNTITAQGPVALDAMFHAGNAVIADLPAAIGVAEADNTQKGSVYRVAAVAAPAKDEVDHAHHGRGRFGAALARAHGARGVKDKPVLVAKNDIRNEAKNETKSETRLVERSSHKRPEEAKAHGLRKAARTRAEGDRDAARRRSHVA
jgi:hypothetical protein